MGAIFSKPKPPPPPPSRLEESIERQEKREAQAETKAKRQVAARTKARTRGGMRNLMTQGVSVQGRDTAMTEGSQTTLGAGRNPRG